MAHKLLPPPIAKVVSSLVALGVGLAFAVPGWESVGVRTWSESAGILLPADASGQSGILLQDGLPSSDGQLDVDLDADQWSGHRGGVVLRYTGPSSYYFIGVRPANEWEPHVYFCKDALDNCTAIGEPYFSLSRNVHLRIIAQGASFKVFLNGDSAAVITDASHPTGRIGVAHASEWNRLCTFRNFAWIGAAQSSSLASSEVPSSSSVAISSSSISISSSSEIVSSSGVADPVVTAKVIGKDVNWYSVALTLHNLGTGALAPAKLGWHYVWTDHSSATDPEIDYASMVGTSFSVEERDDFTGTVWMSIPNALAAGDSAVVHLRLHTSDYTPINRSNDPSWALLPTSAGAAHPGITLRTADGDLLYPVPRLPFPTTARQSATVKTIVTQQSSNTLWLKCLVTNTGVVPLRNVRFQWFADTLASEQPLSAEIDWSQVAGTTVTKNVMADARVAFTISLGSAYVPVGATREVQLRIHSSAWGNVNFADDWSWQGIANATTNAYVALSADGLLIDGRVPSSLDSDGDGVPDVVERQAGSDPFNATSVPMVGIPDRPVIVDNGEKQYVSYDFSNIPGYSQAKQVTIAVASGDFVGDTVPSVQYLGASTNKPAYWRRNFVRAGGFFRVHANITPGDTIQMALPFPDKRRRNFDSTQVQAYRYDTTAQQWQALHVTGFDGAVHVTTSKFSDVQVGVNVVPRSIAAGDSFVVAIDSIASTSDTLFRLLTAGKTAQGWTDSLRVVAGLPHKLRSVVAGAHHALALTLDGKVWQWTDSTATPVLVSFPDTVMIQEIVAGAEHSIATDTLGRLWGWGKNSQGQLGLLQGDGVTPRTDDVLVPELLTVPVENGKPVSLVVAAAGRTHSQALDTLGRLWNWGKNDKGQLLIPIEACPDTAIWIVDSQKTWTTKVCTYSTDSDIHPMAHRTLQGFEGTMESNFPRLPRPDEIAAGREFTMAIRYTQPVHKIAVWGDGMGTGTPRSTQPYRMAGGESHFAILVKGGFGSDTPLPDPHPETEVGPDADGYYTYYYTLLRGGGSNAYGQLGSEDVSARSTYVHVEGAEDLSLGKEFTALWYPDSALDKRVRILGRMGAVVFGAQGKTVGVRKSLQVQILEPQEGEIVAIGGSVPVKWSLNGEVQTSQPLFVVPATSTEGQELEIVQSYTDAHGFVGADTVHVIAKDLKLNAAPVVTGSLEYDGATGTPSKTVTVNLDLNMSANVTFHIRNFDGDTVCYVTKPNLPAGAQQVTWDGFCDDGKWVAEGVHYLDVVIRQNHIFRELYASNMRPKGNALIVGIPFSHDKISLLQSLYSVLPIDEIVTVRPLVGEAWNPVGNYFIIGGDTTWAYSTGCQIKANEFDERSQYQLIYWVKSLQNIISRVIPATVKPSFSNLRFSSIYEDELEGKIQTNWTSSLIVNGIEVGSITSLFKWSNFQTSGYLIRRNDIVFINSVWSDIHARSFAYCEENQ